MKKDLRAVLKVVILTISFVCATAVLFVLLANQEVCAKQKVRTVNYEASTYFDEEFIEQFDDFEFVQNDKPGDEQNEHRRAKRERRKRKCDKAPGACGKA